MDLAATSQLTPQQKRRGQKNYLWFTRLNAISFGSLADSILILYALELGADDFLIAFLSSLIYLTMPVMLIGKRLVARVGTSRAFGIGWIFRNLSASFMLLAPLAQRHLSPQLGLFVLTCAAAGFFLFRSLGNTATTSLLGDITTPNEQGEYLSRVWLHSNTFYIMVLLLNAFLLSLGSSLAMFQRIIALGALTGLMSTFFLFAIPAAKQTTVTGRQPLSEIFKYLRRQPDARRLFRSWILAQSAIALTVPFSMLSLKKGYLFTAENALLFSVIQLGGGIFSSFLNSLFLDRVGPRPLILLYTSAQFVVIILWTIAPRQDVFFHLMLIFLLAGGASAGIQTALQNYFLNQTPNTYRLNASILLNMLTGLITGLMGTLVGGGLLKLFRHLNFDGLEIYRHYFMVIIFFQGLVMFQVYRLKSLTTMRLRALLRILFSLRQWKAMYTLRQLTHSTNEQSDLFFMRQLKRFRSNLSEPTLVKYLSSPRSLVRMEAIRVLRQLEFSETTAALLIHDLPRSEFTSAFLAAEVLGEHHIRSAIPELRRALNSPDIFLQGKAMVALVRLEDVASFPQIIEMFRSTYNPRLIIHGGHALALIKNPELSGMIVEKIIATAQSSSLAQELLFCLAELWHVGDRFYQLFHLFKRDHQAGEEALSAYLQNIIPLANPARAQLLALTIALSQEPSVPARLAEIMAVPAEQPLPGILPQLQAQLLRISNHELQTQLLFCGLLITGTKLATHTTTAIPNW